MIILINSVKRDSHRKYFLFLTRIPRVDIKDYNVLIDGRNVYDQNISDDFKKYEELRKVMTERGEDIKLSKAHINKIIKEGGNLGKLFLPKLIKPAISLGKNILAPLGLSAAMSATDAAIQKKMCGSGNAALIISDNDMNDLIKIVTALEEHDILLKGTSKTIKN